MFDTVSCRVGATRCAIFLLQTRYHTVQYVKENVRAFGCVNSTTQRQAEDQYLFAFRPGSRCLSEVGAITIRSEEFVNGEIVYL